MFSVKLGTLCTLLLCLAPIVSAGPQRPTPHHPRDFLSPHVLPCHSSCSDQSHSFCHVSSLPQVQTCGTVTETSCFATAPGSLQKRTSQRPHISCDLSGAGRKMLIQIPFRSLPHFTALTSHATLMPEFLLSAFPPSPVLEPTLLLELCCLPPFLSVVSGTKGL